MAENTQETQPIKEQEGASEPSAAAAPKDYVIFLEPCNSTYLEIIERLEQLDDCEVLRVNSVQELGQVCVQVAPCLVMASVFSPDDAKLFSMFLRERKNEIRKQTVRAIAMSNIRDRRVIDSFLKNGCNEFLPNSISQTSLLFKINLQLKALRTKRVQSKKAVTIIKGQEAGSGRNAGELKLTSTENPTEETGSLQISEDCWLIKGDRPKKLGMRWVVDLEGPDPRSGEWVEAGSSGGQKKWKWKAKGPDGGFLPDDPEKGEWEFVGLQPTFQETTGKWKMASAEPSLSYVRKGKIEGRKISQENGKVLVAKDSKQAESNIRRSQMLASRIVAEEQGRKKSKESAEEQPKGARKTEDGAPGKGGSREDRKPGIRDLTADGKEEAGKPGPASVPAGDPTAKPDWKNSIEGASTGAKWNTKGSSTDRARNPFGPEHGLSLAGKAVDGEDEGERDEPGEPQDAGNTGKSAKAGGAGGVSERKAKFSDHTGDVDPERASPWSHSTGKKGDSKKGSDPSRERGPAGRPGRTGTDRDGDPQSEKGLGNYWKRKHEESETPLRYGRKADGGSPEKGDDRAERTYDVRETVGLKKRKNDPHSAENRSAGKAESGREKGGEADSGTPPAGPAGKSSALEWRQRPEREGHGKGSSNPDAGPRTARAAKQGWKEKDTEGRSGITEERSHGRLWAPTDSTSRSGDPAGDSSRDRKERPARSERPGARRGLRRKGAGDGSGAVENYIEYPAGHFGDRRGVWERVSEKGYLFVTPEMRTLDRGGMVCRDRYWFLEDTREAPFFDLDRLAWLFPEDCPPQNARRFDDLPARHREFLLAMAGDPMSTTKALKTHLEKLKAEIQRTRKDVDIREPDESASGGSGKKKRDGNRSSGGGIWAGKRQKHANEGIDDYLKQLKERRERKKALREKSEKGSGPAESVSGKKRKQADAERKTIGIRFLLELSDRLNKSISAEELGQWVSETTMSKVAPAKLLVLLRPSSSSATARVAGSPDPIAAPEVSLAVDPLLNQALQEAKPVHGPGAAGNDLVHPLVVGGNVTGFLVIRGIPGEEGLVGRLTDLVVSLADVLGPLLQMQERKSEPLQEASVPKTA